jgi:hypothetical protein
MTFKSIVKDQEFKELAQARVDSKYRVSLGAAGKQLSQFRVYQNALGQIILDPQVSVPAYEARLFKNPKISKSIQKGLEEARLGKITKSKEDYSKYLDK